MFLFEVWPTINMILAWHVCNMHISRAAVPTEHSGFAEEDCRGLSPTGSVWHISLHTGNI